MAVFFLAIARRVRARGPRGSHSTVVIFSTKAAMMRGRISASPKPSSCWPRTNFAILRVASGHFAMMPRPPVAFGAGKSPSQTHS